MIAKVMCERFKSLLYLQVTNSNYRIQTQVAQIKNIQHYNIDTYSYVPTRIICEKISEAWRRTLELVIVQSRTKFFVWLSDIRFTVFILSQLNAIVRKFYCTIHWLYNETLYFLSVYGSNCLFHWRISSIMKYEFLHSVISSSYLANPLPSYSLVDMDESSRRIIYLGSVAAYYFEFIMDSLTLKVFIFVWIHKCSRGRLYTDILLKLVKSKPSWDVRPIRVKHLIIGR